MRTSKAIFKNNIENRIKKPKVVFIFILSILFTSISNLLAQSIGYKLAVIEKKWLRFRK